MAGNSIVVLDASVGVKWFKDEPGSEEALSLLARAAEGEVALVADYLFVYEVLGVLHRRFGTEFAARAYQVLLDARLATVAPDAMLVAAAFRQADALGCDLYDAFSAALASSLDSPLYSSDRAAHEQFPGVQLIGAE